MRTLARIALFIAAVVVALATTATAQQAQPRKEPAGSISGRITIGDKPAVGVPVLLVPYQGPYDKPTAKSTTDEDGRYQLNHIPAGQYQLQSFTPAFVTGEDLRGRPGKTINLNEGESVDQIDITLTRGAVITGRVFDADGQPLIQESVRLFFLDDRGQRFPAYLPYASLYATDDRGIYRIFGIPAGRYILSVGVDTRNGGARLGASTYYPLTYHPDATDQSKATTVEVAAGGEATGIDITVGHSAKSYQVSGRVIDADTGKPVPGVNYGYGSLQADGSNFQSSVITGSVSNVRGEFRLEGVLPGHYSAFATSMAASEFYSDSVPFEVTDADVSGIEIKVHRGSSASGVVNIEGDAEGAPRLADLRLGANIDARSPTAPRNAPINLGADGSFRVSGLKPGKLGFFIGTYPAPKGAVVLRVERDGIEQPGGVEIREGEHVTGLRVVIGYGTGVIRGQVSVEGGVLPEYARLIVSYSRIGSNDGGRAIQPDARGRFVLEGLVPGDYELIANIGYMSRGQPPVRISPVRQTVSVANGAEVQVNLVIEVNKKNQ
ncbi:MAG TPA: hypothetical protein VLM38_20395 [Blastocatellia bacterium]|nr:hypothetical protein [Blastocatellia bacterium]